MSLLSPFNQRGAMANRPVDFGAMSPRFWFNDSHPFLDLFNDRLSKFNQLSSSSANGNIGCWAPYFDVKETKDAYKLEGELPGLEQKDISIEFADNNTLTIRGHIENVHEEGNRTNNANSDDAPDTSTNMKDDKNGATEEQNTDHQAGQADLPTYWVRERSIGDIQRSFSFPDNIDQEHVKACLKNGILSVNIPKVPPTQKKPRKVEVE